MRLLGGVSPLLRAGEIWGVGRWTPAALFAAGQQGVWYEPRPEYLYQDSAGTTPVTADGQPVGYMQDLSGNGNHATQSTAAAKPVYRTDGTLHWLEFDGVDDRLIAVSFSSQDITMIAGIRVVTAPTSSPNLFVNLVSSSDITVLTASETDSRLGYYNGTSYINTASGAIDTSDAVLFGHVDKGNSALLRVDGTTQSGTATPSTATTPSVISIGASSSGSNLFYNGRLYGLTAVDFALSDTQKQNVETYTANLAGVTL